MRIWFVESGPRIRRALLLGLVFLTPLFFLRMANDQMNLPKLSLLIVGLSVVFFLRAAESLQGAPLDGLKRVLVPVGLIAVPLLVAWALSPYRGWALFGHYQRLQGLLPYVVVLLLAIAIADAFAGRLTELAWALVASGAGVGFYGALQVVGLDPLTWSREGVALSTTGNPNFTGGFLGIVLPLVLALWVQEPKRRRWIALLAAPLLLGWILSFSQGGWAAGVAGTLVTLGFLLSGRVRRARLLAALAAGAIALLAAGQVLLGVISPSSGLVPGTVKIRAESWVSASRMWSDSPVVGRGPNTYAIEGAHHRTEASHRQGFNYADDPHSVTLSFATAAGALGVAGFAGLFVWVALRIARLENEVSPAVAAFAGATIAYFVQSLVSIDELSIRVAFWTALAGLAVAGFPRDDSRQSKSKKKRGARDRSLRSPLRVGVAALACLAAIWWGPMLTIVDIRVLDAARTALAGEPAAAKVEFERALSFRDEFEYRRLYGLRVPEGILAGNASEGEDLYMESLESFSYLRDFPHLSRLVEYTRVLRAGVPLEPDLSDRALEVFERMRALDPVNPLIPTEAAELMLERGDAEAAMEWLQPFADKEEIRFASFWGALAMTQAELGNDAEAQTAIDRAVALDPGDENAQKARELVTSD